MRCCVIGKRAFGSTRWIALPAGIHLQVSEFAKIAIILLVARFLTELKTDVLELRDLLKLGGVILRPDGADRERTRSGHRPDLPSDPRDRHLPGGYAVEILGGHRGGRAGGAADRRSRLCRPIRKPASSASSIPERDPQGTGYQLIQSKIAVGAGGTWGKGVTKGSQTQLRFLPVPHTDFIFSAFAEEHGFIGVMVVMILYFVLLMQIVQNAQTAPDRAGMYICMGVGALLLFHILVNVGMVVGRMPVTGIPLPLMSYGGSSIWSTFLMLGLVNSVRVRRFVN